VTKNRHALTRRCWTCISRPVHACLASLGPCSSYQSRSHRVSPHLPCCDTPRRTSHLKAQARLPLITMQRLALTNRPGLDSLYQTTTVHIRTRRNHAAPAALTKPSLDHPVHAVTELACLVAPDLAGTHPAVSVLNALRPPMPALPYPAGTYLDSTSGTRPLQTCLSSPCPASSDHVATCLPCPNPPHHVSPHHDRLIHAQTRLP
jgi:hypothetical protein